MCIIFFFFIVLIIFFVGCIRDDICFEDIVIIFFLYIEFRDIIDRELIKVVEDLFIYVNNIDSILVIFLVINDIEILILLDIELNLFLFFFEFNSFSEENNNFDIIFFNYLREEVYIN